MGIALLSDEDGDEDEDTSELIIKMAWCMNWCRLYSLETACAAARDTTARNVCALTANRERAPAYVGQTSTPQHWAAVQLHEKQRKEELSLAPPACEKELTDR